MMRKLLILVVFLVSVGTAQAQDKLAQPPIIAQRENKWYAVSPIDGSARVIVEPAPDETLSLLQENQVSPDRQWLAYFIQRRVVSPNAGLISDLFLLNLLTDERQAIQPSGGVFDRPTAPTHVFQMYYPTWSQDGTRLYYVRMEVDTQETGKRVEIQLAYYDMAQREHHLTGRLDPKSVVEGVWSVNKGIVVRTFKPDSDVADYVLYAPDNAIVKRVQVTNTLPNPVVYEDETYYAELAVSGVITKLVNAETGAVRKMTGIHYPAAVGLQARENSIRLFRDFGSGTWFHVYGADDSLMMELRDEQGFTYAISPDGESLAYVQYDQPGFGVIQIMDTDKKVRQLPFDAEVVVWGALETQVYVPLG